MNNVEGKKEDTVLAIFASELEERRFNFLRTYQAWSLAERDQIGYYEIQDRWEKYIEARNLYLDGPVHK